MMRLRNHIYGIALVVLGGCVSLSAQTFQNLSGVSGTLNGGLFSTNLAWGDYDGDGLLDLYSTNWGTAVSNPINALFQNQGDGTFVNTATNAGVDNNGNSVAAAFADYDNDGDLDLYIADFYAQDFLYQNQGDGTYSEVGRSLGLVNLERRGNVTSVAWGDYNADGQLDFYLGKFYFANELYNNNGDGTFTPVTDLDVGDARDTNAVLWADYDGDGDADLYTVNREQENKLYRNDLNADGSFADVSVALGVANNEIGQNGTWGDYDNDGDLDLYLANIGANALYENDGGTGFTDVADLAGVRIDNSGWLTAMADWADYDGDGFLDLYLATGSDRQFQRDILYANNGDGTFDNINAFANLPTGPSVHFAARWGDFDGNGAPDLYMTDGFGSGNLLFQNDTPGSRFIQVFVQGGGGEQDGGHVPALGAKVSLLDSNGDLVATRQVDDAAGLSFGVQESVEYRIEVRFPESASVVAVTGLRGGDQRTVVQP
ncbi:MAG: FG-GAP repeat domain-containing protein [Candidatus Latescibacterota bacterium]